MSGTMCVPGLGQSDSGQLGVPESQPGQRQDLGLGRCAGPGWGGLGVRMGGEREARDVALLPARHGLGSPSSGDSDRGLGPWRSRL